ncbi:MAG TPA: MFS transporter, partial [Alkalispirochaeta sp.]|nr:MFS transporter [Alkalispirochaeta sp.]
MNKQIIIVVSFLSFILLGLPDGMLGVAWPSMSRAFAIPLGSLGILMAGFTAGYVITTAFIGSLIVRVGYAAVMIGSAAGLALGSVVLALAPGIVAAIIATVFLGSGSGLLDGGLNAYGAAFFRPRDLNWLHACYGIGAALGPAIMTPMIIGGPGWRGGYAVVASIATVILLLFFSTRGLWNREVHGTAVIAGGEVHPVSSDTVSVSPTRLRVIAAGSVGIFFLYTGLEVVAGQWAFSMFTIERGMSAARAGTWVGLYWAALTVGRLLFGWISERIPTTIILRSALGGVAVGTALLFPTPVPALAPVGLALVGFSLAPIFPLLIGETPRRIGSHRAHHLIGFQIAAANIGAVSFIAIVGVAVERISL